MELLSSILVYVLVLGGFTVLAAGAYMSCFKLIPIQNTETVLVAEPDPFEFEFEWTSTVRRGYLLDHVPTV